jgi:hypothetical protein
VTQNTSQLRCTPPSLEEWQADFMPEFPANSLTPSLETNQDSFEGSPFNFQGISKKRI